MHIFITGGTGFIGTHFINCLPDDVLVTALRRNKNNHTFIARPIKWITGNLDDDFSPSLFEDVDILVHLAAHTANPPYDTLSQCMHWNVSASIKIAEQAISAGVSKILTTGSCFEYGRAGDRYSAIPPTAPLEPYESYPISKAAASVAFSGLARQANIQVKVLRLFQVFGDKEHERRLYPSLIKAALEGRDFPMSSGSQIRDFINVELVAKALVSELDFSNTLYGVPYVQNIGTGIGTSVLDFCKMQWSKLNAKGALLPGQLPNRPNDVMRYVAAFK